MILRRVAQHVREQNWTAIGIDFLIVVVGVFVAIEVSEWKSDRATQARAEMFTSRLTDDLRREAWGYEYVVAYTREVLANAEVAVAGASGDETISDEAFLVGAYRATQYRSYSRRQSTYEELVSTGDIGLITDDTLRAAATLLNNSRVIDTITEDGRTSEYRRVFRRRVPADVQRVLLASCGDRYVEPLDFQGIVGSLDYACDLDLAADRIASVASALRSDPEFLPTLQLRFGALETALYNLTVSLQIPRGQLREIAGLSPLAP